MKRIFLLLLFISFFVRHFRAQSSADQLVKCIFTEKYIDAMVENYRNYIKQAGIKIYKNESDTGFVKFVNLTLDDTKQMMNTLAVNDLPSIYGSVFTEEELTELVRFYSSAIGKKYLEKNPEVSKSLQKTINDKYLPDLQKKIEERVKSCRK
jgi:hypothetical protein